MLRLAGAAMLASVCTAYGFFAASGLRRRQLFLRGFVTSLSVLETEIVFGKYELERIFRRIEDGGELCGLYRMCAEKIRGCGIRAAWKDAAERAGERAALRREDISAVRSLGAELGMSDTAGQRRAIARTRALAETLAADAAADYARLGRPYRICGALAGAFCVLMIA